MDKPITVAQLKSIDFHQMDLHEKMCVIKLGRPLPDLKIVQVSENSKNSRKKKDVRKFNRKVYDDYNWICGCEVSNSFYCFPCILYGGVPAWTKSGINDLKHITTKTKIHRKCAQHIKNVRELKMLQSLCNSAKEVSVKEVKPVHTSCIKDVKGNRLVLSLLLDFLIISVRFNQLSCNTRAGSKNSKHSSNSVALRRFIELISVSDPNVKDLLKNTTKFDWDSNDIKNEIVNCVLCVIRKYIIEEISKSMFLSIMINGTSKISQTTKAVLIVRYVKNSEVVERFWCFLDPAVEDPSSMADCILRELEQILPNCPEKLIAQSYDGTPTMKNVHLMIKKYYPNAVCVHSYAHHLYLVMKNVVSQNVKAKVFFSELYGFSSFFSASPKRVAALNATTKRNYPYVPLKRLNFSIRTVNKVFEQRMYLLKYFMDLKNDPSATMATVHAACNLERLLLDNEFIFWLTFFHFLTPHVYNLNDEISSVLDSSKIAICISEFISRVEASKRIAKKIDIAAQIQSRDQFSDAEIESLKYSAQEVCILLANEIADRFQFIDQFDLANIFLPERFSGNEKQLSRRLIDTVIRIYSNFEKDWVQLLSELSVLYKRNEFTNVSSPQQLLQSITEKNLEETFSGTVKLLKLLLTLPIEISKKGTCFPALKRLKKFLLSTKTRKNLTAITAMHMEKEIMSIPDFNGRVIDLFSSSPKRQLEFMKIKEE